MDTILLTITGISLTLSAVMGTLLARMLRDERRRSDARVALLSELAAEPVTPLRSDVDVPLQRHQEPVESIRFRDDTTTSFPTERTMIRRRPERTAAAPPPPAVPASARPSRFLMLDDVDDFELRAEVDEVPGVQDLFHEQLEPSPWPRRLAVAGGLAAMVAVVAFGWSNLPRGNQSVAAPSGQAADVMVDAPLELLSLRHAQQDGAFAITGLVQNPRAGQTLSNVKATLFVFGPGGTFITSGRAPLDFVSLGPGEESPFVIRVPVRGDVTRYRVGFRGEDDRVLAHVDRRSADAIAQK